MLQRQDGLPDPGTQIMGNPNLYRSAPDETF